MRYLVILVVLLNSYLLSQSVSGIIYNSQDKSPLSNCNILVEETSAGAVSDASGKFRINLSYGAYTIKFTYMGFEPYKQKVTVSKETPDIELEINLTPSAVQTTEVTVTGKRTDAGTISQEIKAKDLQRMPKLYNDVMRAVQILPGVISISELSSGYNVRGGNFDDNLIYLNGFEIYRPFLLRQGVEENQTLINPDLADELKFYNGSFPASYGDKMSSALEVNYNINDADKLSGNLKADLLNSGVSIRKKFGSLKAAAGIRYSYPGLFLNELQTNGDYKPGFYDFQFLGNYAINENSSLETFLLYAHNKFNLTPSDWIGQFGGFARGDYRGMEIQYTGERSYSFNTGLAAIRYSAMLSNQTIFKIAVSMFNSSEEEYSDVSSDSYYLPDANDSGYKEYIKSGSENVNNNLRLISYELSPQIQKQTGNHVLSAGVNIKLSDVRNFVSELFSETGDSVIADYPVNRFINQKFNLNSYSAFIQDEFTLSDKVLANAGIRTTYYAYNKETLLSPRINITWLAEPLHTFTFSWGFYSQPPYYAEMRNKSNVSSDKLKAQRAIQYSAGWEYQFREKLKLNVEAYYKDLSSLIPYYIDREKTEYSNSNSNKGFAYGFDVMVQGEIIEGLNSWFGYGYLNTQEKNAKEGSYYRRLTDNNHSIQIFLQDKIKKHPNWQAHFRLLFNTGYVFNLRRIVMDEQSGKSYIKIFENEVRDYPAMYLRADMGLSASFDVSNYKLIVIGEVLNLFDHRNFGSYRFVQVSSEIQAPFAIPQVLSSRFFNVGVELKF